jgi:hypothetical protein
MRNSITSSRNAYTIHSSGNRDASDLELIHVSPKPKDGWQVENVEVYQHQRGFQEQIQPKSQQARRMASFDSKTPPERSKEWV